MSDSPLCSLRGLGKNEDRFRCHQGRGAGVQRERVAVQQGAALLGCVTVASPVPTLSCWRVSSAWPRLSHQCGCWPGASRDVPTLQPCLPPAQCCRPQGPCPEVSVLSRHCLLPTPIPVSGLAAVLSLAAGCQLQSGASPCS